MYIYIYTYTYRLILRSNQFVSSSSVSMKCEIAKLSFSFSHIRRPILSPRIERRIKNRVTIILFNVNDRLKISCIRTLYPICVKKTRFELSHDYIYTEYF